MSGDDQQFKSRLGGSNPPMRGMGAGFAQNQRLAGAANPSEAARQAAMSPQEAEAARRRVEQEDRELNGMREDLIANILNGTWTKPAPAPDGETVEQRVMAWGASLVRDMHAQMVADLEQVIDQEDEASLREALQQELGIQPDDPLYDPLTDRRRREAIEAQLEPMSFEDLVFTGSVKQVVPLRGNFTIAFRTLPTSHSLWLELFASQLPETSSQHLRHTFSLMQVAACLDEMNGRAFEPKVQHMTKDDEATRKAFRAALEQRMHRLGELPQSLTDDFIVQYTWFAGRVRKLLAGDLLSQVGNS